MTTQPTSPGERVVAAAHHLFDTGVMSRSGHADLSARLDEQRFVLTTTGIVRGLRPDQLATVDLDGAVLDDTLAPENAEVVAMHAVVCRARPNLGGIVHTHSPLATAFALLRLVPGLMDGTAGAATW